MSKPNAFQASVYALASMLFLFGTPIKSIAEKSGRSAIYLKETCQKDDKTAVSEQNANKAASVKISKSTFCQELAGEPAPSGWIYLVLETEWENIHPKQKVEKKKLEGKTDRTMGVKTFAQREGKKKEEYVEVDVAYMIEEFFNHAYLVVDGLAYSLNKLTEDIPGGVSLQEPFTIAKKGEVRQANFVYLIPQAAKNIGFQFFDYDYGHIFLPVQGDLKAARGRGKPPGKVLGQIKAREVEIAAHSIDFQKEYAGDSAPDGWHYALVQLSGKSLSGKNIKNIVQIEPEEYAWVTTDGGYFYYSVGGSTTDEGFIRFTPEIYQHQELAFLIPSAALVDQLGLRIKNEVFQLSLTDKKPEGLPKPIATYRDGNTMEVMVFGVHKAEGKLVLDLGLRSLVKSSGIEIQKDAQFVLNAGGEKFNVDEDSTEALAHRPPDPFIIPPGMFVRFELAYDTNASPSSLYFRGYESENYFKLK